MLPQLSSQNPKLFLVRTFIPSSQHVRQLPPKGRPLRFAGFDRGTRDREPREEAEGGAGRVHLLKSRGQHLLKDERILESIVQKAGVRAADTVLEIGSGTGNLTLKLLRSASSVVAFEVDPRMVDFLQRRASLSGLSERLTVIQGDVLKAQFPPFDICVSNIPYNISSPLLAKLFFGPERSCFRSATLLLQKEFARRLLAEPGDSDFSRLSVNVQLVATVEHIMDVSRKYFVPNPKVDSSLVKICPRLEIPQVNLEEWWAFTRLCFGNRNKTLGAIFRQKRKMAELFDGLKSAESDDCGGMRRMIGEDAKDVMNNALEIGLFREKVIQILKSGGFEEKRPSKLSEDELLHLLSCFNRDGIRFHKQ